MQPRRDALRLLLQLEAVGDLGGVRVEPNDRDAVVVRFVDVDVDVDRVVDDPLPLAVSQNLIFTALSQLSKAEKTRLSLAIIGHFLNLFRHTACI
jgi:hypothetical protein